MYFGTAYRSWSDLRAGRTMMTIGAVPCAKEPRNIFGASRRV